MVNARTSPAFAPASRGRLGISRGAADRLWALAGPGLFRQLSK